MAKRQAPSQQNITVRDRRHYNAEIRRLKLRVRVLEILLAKLEPLVMVARPAAARRRR